MSNKPNLFIYRCVPREQWQWAPENCQLLPHKLSFFLWFQVSHPINMFSSQPKIQNAPMKFSGALFLYNSLLSIILLYKFQLFQPTWIQISTLQFSETTVVHLGSLFLEFVPKLTFYLLVWSWSDCRAHLISFPFSCDHSPAVPITLISEKRLFQMFVFQFSGLYLEGKFWTGYFFMDKRESSAVAFKNWIIPHTFLCYLLSPIQPFENISKIYYRWNSTSLDLISGYYFIGYNHCFVYNKHF